MSLPSQYKTFSENRPWTARILFSLVVILILLALVRVAMPLAIKIGAGSWFKSNGIEVTIGDIEIALFSGSFAINDVAGKSETGKNFSLGRLAVAWQWPPLFDNKAIIEQVDIHSLKANAAFYKNGDMNIAGLVIKTAAEEQPAEAETQVENTPSNQWDATVKAINFSDLTFCIEQYSNGEQADIDYCATLASFDWNGSIDYKATTQEQTPDTPPLYVKGTLYLGGLSLNNNQLGLALLNIGEIDIRNIAVETPMNVRIEQIAINTFTSLQRNAQNAGDSHVVGFESLSIHPLTLSQLNDLQIGTVKLAGTQTFIHIDENGQTDFAKWLPPKKEQPEANETKPNDSEDKNKPFSFAINQFLFDSDKHFLFVDDSLKESFKADIHDVDLAFNKLDSKAPDTPSHITLALAVGEHGSFKIDTSVTPIAKRPSVDGKGEIAGLDLRTFAPFTRQHIGHNIKSGQLDADLKLAIDKGIIDSNMGLKLHHFELKALSKKEAEELNSDFGLPLNSSLSLLRDRDNTISLDIPVTGDIDSPEFDPNDAIYKATSKAITTAVLHYYTPFGLVFAAESLFDLATALNFEPVAYEAGESKLTSAHEEQLNRLSTLMAERPGVHLTLCGISNKTDREKLFPPPANSKQADNKQEQAPANLTKEQIAELKNIASARSAGVKNYLVKQKKIKASRLVECAPEFEADNKIAGVEISI